MSFGRRISLPLTLVKRERYALALLLLFFAFWGGMLVHSYTHRELAPALHQHTEDEHHHEDNCSACHIVLPTLYASVSCYSLPPQSIYQPQYTLRGATAPRVRPSDHCRGRAPPLI